MIIAPINAMGGASPSRKAQYVNTLSQLGSYVDANPSLDRSALDARDQMLIAQKGETSVTF